MKKETILQNTIDFVKETLQNAEGGHDWFHIERVYKNAKLIALHEDVDLFIVELAALLHDIADAKFHEGDETIGPKKAVLFLKTQDITPDAITHIVAIIANMSFSKSLAKKQVFTSLEMQVVQDADRLDAIGAIGVSRAFNYGGFKNRPLYNPSIKPNTTITKEAYQKSTSPTINHFHEKLLLLKDKMNTQTGKDIAKKRHDFMEHFLAQFFMEWHGEK